MRAVARHKSMYSLSCSCQDDSHNQKYVMFLAQFLNLVLFHVHYIKFTKLQLLLVHCLLPYLELAAKVLLYWRMWHSFKEIASNQNIEDGLLYQIFRLKKKPSTLLNKSLIYTYCFIRLILLQCLFQEIDYKT